MGSLPLRLASVPAPLFAAFADRVIAGARDVFFDRVEALADSSLDIAVFRGAGVRGPPSLGSSS
jgi:hypothetical protein